METRTVSATKAIELQVLLDAANAGTLQVGPAYNKIESNGNVLLVDPLNADPFVFVAPSTVHIFPSKPGSGADHLRQRMQAGLWFQQLSSQPSTPRRPSFGM